MKWTLSEDSPSDLRRLASAIEQGYAALTQISTRTSPRDPVEVSITLMVYELPSQKEEGQSA